MASRISSQGSYDHFGATYDLDKIVNPDATFNEVAYKEYGPLFISTTSPSPMIWTQACWAMNKQPDIHAHLMLQYPQVLEWWYSIIFLAVFAFGVISVEVWNTKFPVQYFILTLVISLIYLIPIRMIQTITHQQVGLNIVTELIIGYALPRHPVAMMMFKTWGYITMAQDMRYI
ncbi:OPT oligopeptide transporter protein-domain-containing protein [Armillaria novae-zelandiae]|uniref:OPT oligopeptide transporter protein-domain-containing protein n=1 Tax=Armillaria novae-zelandiae TaxID=153914 RepID=A0AA39TZV5_9AGAR|nr:OPT oligopeptide transporter protein-domain-containing protein [Armillaria novae-zelandiae]